MQTALICHCEQNGNRMAILDAPPGMTPQQIQDWRSETAMYDSRLRGAVLPLDQGREPDRRQRRRRGLHPARGHIAGVWARTDETRGVWKAPANDTIRGSWISSGASPRTSSPCSTRSASTASGRSAPAASGSGAPARWPSDTDWRYINVRRLFNMVESTILEGTQYAVFEPNDVALWEGVKRTLNAFLRGLWSAGALFGASRPTRRSTSSATPRPTRRSRSTRASS